MRNILFQYYGDWLIMFGKDRATGELAKDLVDSVAAMENEEAIGEKGDESPVEQFCFNETNIDFNVSFSRMAEIAHRIRYSHDLSQQRRLVNTKLLKLPISTGQRLKGDLFLEEDKMEWVCMLLESSII
ncbi:hypothetical protein ACSBR2_001904 [Camellia fascicularis]